MSRRGPALRRLSAARFAALALVLSACAPAKRIAGERPPAREIFMEPLHIGIEPDRELGLIDFDAAALLQEGLRLHQEGRCDRALPFYDRVLRDFSDSRYYSAAAFNAGRCLEELSRGEEAVERYRLITRGLPRSKDFIDAGFRESGCLADLGRQREAADLLGELLGRAELTAADRIDALVLRGEALAQAGEILSAEAAWRQALRAYRRRGREEYLDPRPAARAEFRLAELSERRFCASPLRLPEERMQADLETKAGLLLEAQAGYLRCIRIGDPEWATAAGYRIGDLYLHLHQAMEQAPLPADLAEEEIPVYREVLRRRTAVLLRKALKVFQMTLEISERTFTSNRWTQAARERMTWVQEQVLSLYEELPAEEGSPQEGPAE